MLTKVAVRQANCAQFCGAPTLDDVTLEGCPLEERIERFNYDYRMQCQYGGFVRVPADVYWDKAIINGGVVPCGDCEDGIEVAGEVTSPRDPDDRALSNDGVPGLAWYHTSTYAEWPSPGGVPAGWNCAISTSTRGGVALLSVSGSAPHP